jgi:phosphoglycerol transferase MdoB-like AlkP superfamily enzyme
MILTCGVLFLFIRGGVTTATANVSKAYFSNNLLLNQVAVNPVFSLMESTFERNEKELDNYDYYDSEEAERIFAEALRAEKDTTVTESSRWLNTDRPDIMLVVMEGMGRTMTDIYEGSEPVAPEINRLKNEGIWFDHIYASSFRTDRGNLAIFSGFPGQPNMSLMKYPNKAAKLPGLAGTLKDEGYITRFTYGGDANFTNTRAYVFSSGFEELVDDKSLNLTGHVSKWGYADDIVLDYAADAFVSRIRETDKPVFDAILTLSSHEPFEVPYKRLDSPLLNSFAFTDEMIGRFVEKLRATEEWENMLIILVPDHSTPHPVSIGNNSPERHHIPMLWLGGAVKEDMTVSDYMAQTDLAATLLGQLGIAHDQFIFSRDISSPETSRFGYWAFKNGFGMIDENGVTIYDCSTESLIRSEGDPDLSRHDKGKAILQKTFIEIRKM